MFRLWLFFVILQLLLSVSVVFAKEHDVCKHEKKYSQIWYINGCDKPQGEKNTPWKGYENLTSSEIPQNANPNYKILKHYLKTVYLPHLYLLLRHLVL